MARTSTKVTVGLIALAVVTILGAPTAALAADDTVADEIVATDVVVEESAPAEEITAPEPPAEIVAAPEVIEAKPTVEVPSEPIVELTTLRWILPDGGTPEAVTWPQPVASDANLALVPCGTSVWIQVDTGPAGELAESFDDDGILTLGEDYGWVQSWTFEQYTAAACEPEVPTYLPSCTTVTGAQAIEGDGVLTVTGGWESTSIAVPFSGTLADIGTVLDIQADPLQYVGLHIDTALGSIVFEEEPSYGGKLWSNAAWAGVEPGLGYAAFGTIEEFIHLNGAVEVTGIRLLYTHPEASATTVEQFTIGCTVFTFEPAVVVPPTEEPPVVVPPVVVPPVVTPPTVVVPDVVTASLVTPDTLASTGSEGAALAPVLTLAAVALALLGGVLAMFARARRVQGVRRTQVTE